MTTEPAATFPSHAPAIIAIEDAPDQLRLAAPTAMQSAAIPLFTPTLNQGLNTMINSTEDLVALGKDNLQAISTASKIWVAGVQDISAQVASSAKASFEESVAAFKALTSVKSIKEAIELQTAYGKTAVAKAFAESTRLTEASLKLTEQAMAPLTARVAVAAGSFAKAA